MPTRITQVGQQAGATRQLKVEGALTLADAELLAAVCAELRAQSGAPLRIDLADNSFRDSESASVLCCLKRQGITPGGLDLFVCKIVELAERNGDG